MITDVSPTRLTIVLSVGCQDVNAATPALGMKIMRMPSPEDKKESDRKS